MTPSRSNRQPRMPSGSPSTDQAYESPPRHGYADACSPETTGACSPAVDPGGQLVQRPLVGAGVADHHRYAVRVPAFDQPHAIVAARIAVGISGGEDALGPGQVLLPRRRPYDVLDTDGPERMRRLVAHRAQDQARAAGVAEQRRSRAAIGD